MDDYEVERQEKDILLMNSNQNEKLVQTRVHSQDVKKPKVVAECNSMMVGVDISDALLVCYHSSRKDRKSTI
jgi:hypothetical protein